MIRPTTDTMVRDSPRHLRELGMDSVSEDGAETYIKNITRINCNKNCILRVPYDERPLLQPSRTVNARH